MRILAAMLCSTALLAQAKTDPLRYVPAEADVVMRVVGPAAWRRDFAATGLGKAFADPELAPIWERLVKYFGSTFELDGEVLGEEGRGNFQTAWRELQGYGGDIVFAGRVDWDAVDVTADHFPGAGVLVFGGADGVDLDSLIEKVTAMLPAETEGEMEVAGVAAPVRDLDGTQLVGPFQHDGNAVLLIGQDLEKRSSWFFEGQADRVIPKDLRTSSFFMEVQLKSAVAKLFEIMETISRPDGPLLRLIGVEAMRSFSFSVYPDEGYVGQKIELRFGEESRGLIDVVVPPRTKRPGLLRYLPAGAGTYASAPMDIAALERFYKHSMTELQDDLPISREEIERRFTEMTKVDLFKDILAHIGDEYMRIDDLSGEGDYDEDDSEAVANAKEKLADGCFVIKLRDGRALAKSLNTMIRARGLHVGRKRTDYQGTNIYSMNLLGMLAIEYAVTDSLLVIGVGGGEGTKQNLRGVLDAASAVAAGGDVAPLAKEVDVRLAGMPADWCGIQVASFVDLLETISGGFDSLEAMFAEEGIDEGDLDESWRLIFDTSKALKSALPRHGAGVVVNLDYYQKDRYVMRSRW